MVRVYLLLALVGLVSVVLGVVPPQAATPASDLFAASAPPNDMFANATTIAAIPFTTSQSTLGATTEAGEPPPPCRTLFWLTASARHDLNVDGKVSAGDAFLMFPRWLATCG